MSDDMFCFVGGVMKKFQSPVDFQNFLSRYSKMWIPYLSAQVNSNHFTFVIESTIIKKSYNTVLLI